MEKSKILLSLMLLFSMSAWAQHDIKARTDLADANENGTIELDPQSATAGTKVTVTCRPKQGYGLSKGAFFAIQNANGTYAAADTTKATSTHPADRCNATTFEFVMPDHNVGVWAYFTPQRTLVNHRATGGKLEPVYGYEKSKDDTILRNVPQQPLKFKVIPDVVNGLPNQLVNVSITNVNPSYVKKGPDYITVVMPNEDKTVHVTPLFAKAFYNVSVQGGAPNVTTTLSTATPKTREEVEVVLTSKKGYIPAGVTFKGCSSWWRVGKPKRLGDGGWEVVYRFKVEYEDVTVSVGYERVYDITLKDTENSGRLQIYVPDMIPDYPGVARSGQQVPVLFMMPRNYSVTFKATEGSDKLAAKVYHNVLKNSFADQGLYGWSESSDYVGKGLSARTDVDSTGNNFWRTSVKNTLSQKIRLTAKNLPASAKVGGNVDYAVLVSINPNYARIADVNFVSTVKKVNTKNLICGLQMLENKKEGWQTVFKSGQFSASAESVSLVVSAEGGSPEKKFNHDGPMFDDLCLLLPASNDSIKNEDVLVFKVDNKDITIAYTPKAKQGLVSVVAKDHATVTLKNLMTDEEGSSVKAMESDIIAVKATYDEGYAIRRMNRLQKNKKELKEKKLAVDSFDVAKREVYYYFAVKRDEPSNITITPVVSDLMLSVNDNYGGLLTVVDESVKEGEKVLVTVQSNPGCKLKQIRTSPAGLVTIVPENVDEATGNGTYSFVMPATNISLTPDFIVPITTAAQLDSLDQKTGEFNLMNDLDLGTQWNDKDIYISGIFNGNGHRITYGGTSSLFGCVEKNATVCHLFVHANVKDTVPDINTGGIAKSNEGLIEDCELSGQVQNTGSGSIVGGIAGQNGPRGGVISRCHVVCDVIDAPVAAGIAYQEEGGTIKNCIFNGKFGESDVYAYMVANEATNGIIEGNSYIANIDNERAMVIDGVTQAQPVELVDAAKHLSDRYPVFSESVKNRYIAYLVTTEQPNQVEVLHITPTTGIKGTVVSGLVRVKGNNHLDSIIVSAPDGSDAQSCPFTDNTEKEYSFSFTLSDHNALITFKTAVGAFIYTAKQFEAIHNKKGTYYLVRDLNLHNWEKRVNLDGKFYGGGHTIRYNVTGNGKALFNKIRKNSLLEGLRVVGFITSYEECAGITYESQGTIRNCHFTGSVKRQGSPIDDAAEDGKFTVNRVAAIALNVGDVALIDHCSASGELISKGYDGIGKNPLCAQSDAKITNSHWISSDQTTYPALLSIADAARDSYPVYAQGIYDKINTHIVVGNDTIRVKNGETLDELTIVDGQPFECTGDVKVNRVIYKRQAMPSLEQWVLPFAFDHIAGDGQFEYHKTIEEKKLPDILPGKTLTLSDAPSSIAYNANEPWLVKTDGSGAKSYVLTNNDGPITIKTTHQDYIAGYASLDDIGTFYVTYDSIPDMAAAQGFMYVWDIPKQDFILAGDSVSVDIQPFRFYAQFYNKESKSYVDYKETQWGKNTGAETKRVTTAPRRLAAAMADGWQPVFLDPRQPQGITDRMLDYYDVAYLTDIDGEIADETSSQSLSAVSLIYQIADSRMELPKALPLLVRPKHSGVEPLVDLQTGVEVDSLYTASLIQQLLMEDNEEEVDSLPIDMPHYWCASFGNRLDVWQLPAPERYGDLAEFGCMMFDDNYFEQSFTYADAADNRTTAPMSYCITVLNADTYELLPLMDDRVSVVFIQAGEATGIDTVQRPIFNVERSTTYNLSGQRVNESYKGVVIQNGRKVIKR